MVAGHRTVESDQLTRGHFARGARCSVVTRALRRGSVRSRGDVKAYTKKLAGGPDTGVVNLTKNAGNVTFDVLISGWMVANFADNNAIPGLPSLYTYKVYDMRNIETVVDANITPRNGVYPLKVTAISGANFAMSGLQARTGSGNYFFIARNAGSPARTFRFLNADGATAASFTGANWILLRTR